MTELEKIQIIRTQVENEAFLIEPQEMTENIFKGLLIPPRFVCVKNHHDGCYVLNPGHLYIWTLWKEFLR